MRRLTLAFVLLFSLFVTQACSGVNELLEGISSESDGGATSEPGDNPGSNPGGSSSVPHLPPPTTADWAEDCAKYAANPSDTSLPFGGYYKNAYGKTGAALKTALQTIISTGHVAQGYGGLWTLYKTADIIPAGVTPTPVAPSGAITGIKASPAAGSIVIWDIYSNYSDDGSLAKYWFTWQTHQDSGSGSGEAAVYNREHTWPVSYFGGNTGSVPGNDGHHILPTDKIVNAWHGNDAYGEVGTLTRTSLNGTKFGSAKSDLGYSGAVTEVIDIYKGDLARMHFYMAVRYYNDSLFTVTCPFANNGAKLKAWYDTMLKRWHTMDPVSQKEIDRNNAVKAHQGNRNPFIDYPGLVDLVDFQN
jgi:endonuclease I